MLYTWYIVAVVSLSPKILVIFGDENMDTTGSNLLSTDKLFFAVDDVIAILGISKSTAYREIKKLNDELRAKGYITISGKIPVKYFMERLYC